MRLLNIVKRIQAFSLRTLTGRITVFANTKKVERTDSITATHTIALTAPELSSLGHLLVRFQ